MYVAFHIEKSQSGFMVCGALQMLNRPRTLFEISEM